LLLGPLLAPLLLGLLDGGLDHGPEGGAVDAVLGGVLLVQRVEQPLGLGHRHQALDLKPKTAGSLFIGCGKRKDNVVHARLLHSQQKSST
jgi:hypothetical protein